MIEGDNAKMQRWREMATDARREAARAESLLHGASEPDAGIDSGALVSIALSLAVIAEVVVEGIAGEIDR